MAWAVESVYLRNSARWSQCLQRARPGKRDLVLVQIGEHDLFMLQSRRLTKEVGHFRQIFDREDGIAHQPLLMSEN